MILPQGITLDLYPAWKDALLEDLELQEKACERLVAYINEGRTYSTTTGQAPVSVSAEKIEVQGGRVGHVVWGVRLTIPVEIEVRWR